MIRIFIQAGTGFNDGVRWVAGDRQAGGDHLAGGGQSRRTLVPVTKVGHAGTLDPLATGVLVLCVGMATRLTEYVQRMSKTYAATIVFGAVSDTDDADGAITPMAGAVLPTRERIEQALLEFVGTIEQVPPAYSAAKVTGRRAYDLRGQGKRFRCRPARSRSTASSLLQAEYPRAEIRVRCGKGTYIRSLARDLGQRLGCGGYIESLCRLAIGPFTAADAIPLAIRCT